MIDINRSREIGGAMWEGIDAEGYSTGRIPVVVGGAIICTGGDGGVNGRVVSDAGAGASATALEAVPSRILVNKW